MCIAEVCVNVSVGVCLSPGVQTSKTGHCRAFISSDYTEAPVMATPALLNETVIGHVSGKVLAFVLPDVHSLILP